MTATPLPLQRDDDGCLTLRLEQPGAPVVVLDHPLIQRLELALLEAAKDTRARCLILASASERVFVAGADLRSIQDLPDDQLDRYLAYGQQVFGMLSQLPFPTAAAINGAAVGGGLELAMHCDGLIGAPSPMGKPYPVGLPEAGLSICPGWGGTNLLPARMDPAEAIRRTATGQTMTFDEAVKAGLFDTVASSAGELLATAKAWLLGRIAKGTPKRDGMPSRWIGRPEYAAKTAAAVDAAAAELPVTASARAVLNAVRTGLGAGGWQGALDLERRELVRLRSTPEGKAAIRGFFEKSAGQKKSG